MNVKATMVTVWLGMMLATGPVWGQDSPAPTEAQASWWGPEYLLDYGIIAAGGAGFLIGENMEPRQGALIGPSYDPENPTLIFENDEVGRLYLEEGEGELVPTEWMEYGVAGTTALTLALGGLQWHQGRGTGHHYHEGVMAWLEGTALTAAATSLTKPLVGRLRPDYGDRALLFHCQVEGEMYPAYCEDVDPARLGRTEEEAEYMMLDGRRSFFSGHSSHALNLGTYWVLFLGGEYVWGDRATETSRMVVIPIQAILAGASIFVVASRLLDGRHHPADTLVGSAVGLGFASMAYWRRFDVAGNPRRGQGDVARGVNSMEVSTFGAGLQVSGRW